MTENYGLEIPRQVVEVSLGIYLLISTKTQRFQAFFRILNSLYIILSEGLKKDYRIFRSIQDF